MKNPVVVAGELHALRPFETPQLASAWVEGFNEGLEVSSSDDSHAYFIASPAALESLKLDFPTLVEAVVRMLE